MVFSDICVSSAGGFAANNIFGASWIVLVFMALVLSYLVMAVLWMVSSFLRNVQLEGWVKYEIFQLAAIGRSWLYSHS